MHAVRRSEQTLPLAVADSALFRILAEASTDALLLVDGSGRLCHATPRVRDVLGWGPEELVGRDALSVIHPGDLALLRELYGDRLAEPGRTVTLRFRGQHRDGRWRHLEGTATNHLHEPAVRGFICSLRDVTNRLRAEDAFRAGTQRFRALVQTAGIVIIGLTVDLHILEFNREAERVFGRTREDVLRRDYLSLMVPPESRAAVEAEFRGALAGQAVRDAESLVQTRDGRRRTLRWNVSRLSGPEEGREGAAAAAGLIATGQDVTEARQAEAALRDSEDRFRHLLEDLEQSIFLKDAESRFLAVNRRFCEGLGVPEEQVHIFLPRLHADAPSVPERRRHAPPRGHETILLVDDEAALRHLGRNILQRLGYQVLLAADGVEAVETFARERSRIELVVLDLTMPRLSGRDAVRRLREIDPAVCIVFASGYGEEHLTQEEQERLAGFVSKPYRLEDLAVAVRAALDQRKSTLEAARS